MRTSRISRFALYFVTAMLLALLILEAWSAWTARAAQLKETYAAVNNVSFSLAQHANETFKEADIMLSGIVERVQHDGLTPGSLSRLHRILADGVRELSSLNGIFIFDENGGWLVTSQDILLKKFNNADREYFQYHRDHPDWMPHIGPPIISRSTGRWIFTISRRINKSDGSFGGVVLATINSDFFAKFYDRFEIGDEGSLAMGLMNGIMLYRRPLTEDYIGRNISGQVFYKNFVLQKEDGIDLINSSVDHVTRYVSYRRVHDYPIFVTASLSRDEVLADWARGVVVRGIFFFIGLILFSYFGYRLIVNIRSREVAEQRLRHARTLLRSRNRMLKRMAMQDGLTGLANRRQFDQALAEETRRAHRNGSTLSLLMIDVDFFKRYNDRYGHQFGDECLKKIAKEMTRCAQRPGDLVARYGGEEFAIILPDCSNEGAESIAKKICERIRQLDITHEDNSSGVVTVSAGLATMRQAIVDMHQNELLSAADAALYLAKSSGRDCCMSFSPNSFD